MNKEDLTKKYIEFQTLNQKIQQTQQQLQLLSNQTEELRELIKSLKEISKVKEDSEMYTNLGIGVYIKSKLKEIKNLLVNVGAGVYVTKTPEETVKIVTGQVVELDKFCIDLDKQVQEFIQKAESLKEEISKAQENK